MNKKQILLAVTGAVSGLAASVIYLYLQYTLVAGGIYADKHGTDGYISDGNILLGILMVSLVILSLILLQSLRKKHQSISRPITIFQICLVIATILASVVIAFM